ncbi:cupin domain-containing protein [Fluviicola sp.]|uniref:cupin domain-containing protein n=1 Tax=Fluviicola sp. TaxID=1917219 RepID=UPI003D2B6D97
MIHFLHNSLMGEICDLTNEMKAQDIKPVEEVTNSGLSKSQSHVMLEIIEYVPYSIVSKTVIKQSNGSVIATSFDEGEKFCEKTIKSDIYVQIIDGKAVVTIDNIDHKLNLGEGIIIPGNSLHCFKAEEKFKMITTIITSIADKDSMEN